MTIAPTKCVCAAATAPASPFPPTVLPNTPESVPVTPMQMNASRFRADLSPKLKMSNFTPADDVVLADASVQATQITTEKHINLSR